jgi:lipid II:glycine glycyltransferase (peptidoglycan interpeptide bridge formation enzyme)
MPLMYIVMWDLIRWAKREGAAWFDFGGVTQGASDSEDPLRRISDFKRRFCQNDILLGEEWIFEPNKMKAWIARAGTESVRWLRRSLGRSLARIDTSATETLCRDRPDELVDRI